jgi:hypothetical protein
VFFDFKNSTNENNFAFSTSSKFPGTYAGEYNSDNSLFVFVIRRDSNNVVTVYGRKGGILATIPANGSTDGELEINRIGGALGVSKLKLARFGVINKDMGNDFCVGLGPTLYNRYKV